MQSLPIKSPVPNHRTSITIIITVPAIPSTKLSSNPILMVRTHVSVATDAKFIGNVDITLMINGPRFVNLLDRLFIALPWSTAVDTLHLSRLASSPLFEASAMNVLAAGSFAPENIVQPVRFVKLHDTYGAIAFNWLAGAARVSDLSFYFI
jgi:hypothetical protein